SADGTAVGAGGQLGGSASAVVHRAVAQPTGVHGGRVPRFSRGIVVARGGVALRSRPDWDSRVLRVARPGEIVWIFCRTPGWDLYGGRVWYLLADRAWAWAPARFIENIGPAPRWC
ncbi:SH3 domain-containing protein, partial [Streptomyces thermoalcalitolerans]|uniref:SH3 domain-containing protein n=1 Tax=Streptomyces thermoalcalitolerans TaxID=65605 RepID=UPI0031D6D466